MDTRHFDRASNFGHEWTRFAIFGHGQTSFWTRSTCFLDIGHETYGFGHVWTRSACQIERLLHLLKKPPKFWTRLDTHIFGEMWQTSLNIFKFARHSFCVSVCMPTCPDFPSNIIFFMLRVPTHADLCLGHDNLANQGPNNSHHSYFQVP